MTTTHVILLTCVKVQVEDCYFEGRTAGWRGHLLAYGCGPTSIRHCEGNGRGHNMLRGTAWLFPYVFDGGSWYVLGNRWEEMTSAIASGRKGQTDGWAPKEGMPINGAKMFVFNNRFENKPGATLRALYVDGRQPALKECIVADYNHYALNPPPAAWALEKGGKLATLEAWRAATGNDAHSILGAGSRNQFERAPSAAVKLPGGLSMQWGEVKAGLTGSVGVQNAGVIAKAKALREEFARDFAERNFVLEAETLPVTEKTLEVASEKRPWAGGGAYLVLQPKAVGESVSFLVQRGKPGRYLVESKSTGAKGGGRFKLLVDGKAVGGPVDFSKRGQLAHGITELAAGEHRFTYTAEGTERGELDAVEFRDADAVEKETARLQASKAQADVAKAEKAQRDSTKITFDFAELTVSGKPRGRIGAYPRKGGAKYLLWTAKGPGDALAFEVDVPQAGTFAVTATTSAQADKGQLALAIAGKDIGPAAPLGGSIELGTMQLIADRHIFTLKLAASATGNEAKVRLLRLELSPKE